MKHITQEQFDELEPGKRVRLRDDLAEHEIYGDIEYVPFVRKNSGEEVVFKNRVKWYFMDTNNVEYSREMIGGTAG